jgi:ATP-dependent 26S proteasome regulatory subunit
MISTQTQADISLEHLQAELARIEVLIQREALRWQLAGQDPADRFRGLHVTDAEAEMLLDRPPGTSWGQMIALSPAEAEAFARAEEMAADQARSLAEVAHQEGEMLRLECLAAAFDFDAFDLDTLLICLAPALDLRYERLYGYLQDDVTRRRPRVNLVLDLLCPPGLAARLPLLARFSDEAPLFRHGLLEKETGPDANQAALLSQVLGVDETVTAWLLGDYHPPSELGSAAALIYPDRGGTDGLLAGERGPQLRRALAFDEPLLAFYGPDDAAQAAAARLLARWQGRPLLVVDLAEAAEAGVPLLRALRLALRDARMTGAIPCLLGWDACLLEGGPPPSTLLAQACAHPGLVLIGGSAPWQAAGIERKRTVLWFEFPIPAYAQRRALWQHFMSAEGLETEGIDLGSLAGQFALTARQIRDTVVAARDMVAQRGGSLAEEDLFTAARAHSSSGLIKLAHKIEPRYTWHDIVLPADQREMLHELVSTVRERPLVLDEWGIGRKLASSAGITALFSGPPGTGKTMAAEVIAAELGLDLFKIDLSTVVSKYIGETEKNLEQIFNEAENSNSILFFDEADAIFGKRSEVKDAHDRYANVEISYLLQRMEAYSGVTILATNLRANLDEAFTRRLQFAIDFPFPDEAYRLRIWQTLFPPGVPRDAEIDFDVLARRFKLAGGNIRNIIVSAAYLAAADGGQVSMQHLLHGIRRELQKMGRLVDEAELSIHS